MEPNLEAFYRRARALIGDKTPLGRDCGVLCGCACCKGSAEQGMRLLPEEASPLKQTVAEGGTLAVCNGQCNRAERPIACRIFPFVPYLHTDGSVTAELDARALRLCPLVAHSQDIRFDRSFLRAVRAVGRLFAQEDTLRAALYEMAAEVDTYRAFYDFHDRPSARIGP